MPTYYLSRHQLTHFQPFASGLHYTNFTTSLAQPLHTTNFSITSLLASCGSYTDKTTCPFHTFPITVRNTGGVRNATSDYVALAFLGGKFGPAPYPKKSLVAYQRLHNITVGNAQTASLNLTLGSLARVDGNGNTVLYPGNYSLMVDNDAKTVVNFTLNGREQVLDLWPQPPSVKPQGGNYYVGGFGSLQTDVSDGREL